MVSLAMKMSLTSPSFADGAEIPRRYTSDGEDLSPPLAWSGVPPGTASLALIVDDPDAPDPRAPRLTWVHWVLYDVPPSTTKLAEGASRGSLPAGTRTGMNDFHHADWGGPSPPIGRHRYFFKLYALDVAPPDLRTPTKAALEKAMHGHVLAEAQLMGTYQKTR
jgi:Raf kinase inhibitor-like YbhB/YbcL family protein